MTTIILGAGLSGISTAYFLQQKGYKDKITILEKEERPGGLCRSIRKGDYIYDIGPHILFSKDKEALEIMLNVLEKRNDLKRSNKILYKGKQVQYPFENDLSKLPKEDLDYCINAFNNNPYENYEVTNMIQFFLKTFGEGITNCYLRPYNEKIWKYDPAFMNTSMVERIPKPTSDEIQRSAKGETIDGYVHQLYFSYPTNGGIESIPNGFVNRLDMNTCSIEVNKNVIFVGKKDDQFVVKTKDGSSYSADQLISTIPIQELTNSYEKVDESIKACVNDLHYNSIIIAFVKTPYDFCGDNYAFMIPDKNVIFHRISKMDFLGSEYHHNDDEATYMVEVTFRNGDQIDNMDDKEIMERISKGFVEIGFATNESDVSLIDVARFQYAYVIYDLNHTENMEKIRDYYKKEGLILNGRFGNFEYWNMDRIVRESYNIVSSISENN